MSALINYTWHSALWSAIELDPNNVARRLDEATQETEERMKMLIEPMTQSIQRSKKPVRALLCSERLQPMHDLFDQHRSKAVSPIDTKLKRILAQHLASQHEKGLGSSG